MSTTAAELPLGNLARAVGLSGPGAKVLFGLFAVCCVLLAVVGGGEPSRTPLGVAALDAILLGGGLLSLGVTIPLPFWRVAVTLVIVAGSTAAIIGQLPPGEDPGYRGWCLGMNTFLLFAVALHGRVGAAWFGMGALVLACALWSTMVSGSPWPGIALSYAQAVGLIVGTVFALGLRRAAQQIDAYHERARERAVAEELDGVADAARRAELTRVRAAAEPLLRAVAEGRLNQGQRRELETVGAALRDGIRGRALARPPLVEAAAAARGRGIDVLILDDAGERPVADEAAERAARWAAERLRSVRSGEVTLRLAVSEGRLAVTVVADGVDDRLDLP